MANGKGWLDCFDCSYHSNKKNNKKSICTKYNIEIQDQESIDFKHRFCSFFTPTSEKVILLNGSIRTEGNRKFYYVYKPESDYYNQEKDNKIELQDNILYGYYYMQPDVISKLGDLAD
ncbi:MAG TPA: hypothetical protein PK419_11030 [Spirochaetota bacterium]|jgi:hypothetical protein|nr:hypothetical protein [Spirochaetota bacterium]HPY03315.1 hypothetical protein [Spirochaetota bacterium]HQA53377.1 hypothetical protein [Spirochaetota bacterium]